MRKMRFTIKTALFALSLALCAGLLLGCSAAPEAAPTPSAAPSSVPSPTPKTVSDYKGLIRISELMVKNHATVRDSEGRLSDYIEIENISAEDVSLEGFSLADGEDESLWYFPDVSIPAGKQLLVFAHSDGGGADALCCDFALSLDETVVLRDNEGLIADRALCSSDTADVALCLDGDGLWQESMYPSPGYANGHEGYAAWQESLETASPLIINEVMCANKKYLRQEFLGYCDWVELKNISDEPVELSDYWLSDDDDFLELWHFPKRLLQPGECVVVLCDDSTFPADGKQLKAPFKLSARRERLYLSHGEQGLCDYVFLRDIPYDRSYGRIEGFSGWFFIYEPSPGGDNGYGWRRVSAPPEALSKDGVFDSGGITVELSGSGTIYYSLDGSLPGPGHPVYTGPFTVDSSCIVRAVSAEEDAMPSRALTLSYIIGEAHSLPVLSLVTDDAEAFRSMYTGKRKDMEVAGSISLYEPEGSFTIGCGIEMHGEASLNLPKKNMSLSFSGAYGQAELEYDIYDGGVQVFSDLILRSGQDFSNSIVKNELLENLLLEYSDCVPSQRSKHCVLYINGQYCGLYALMEKLNEEHYAKLTGVDEDSVTVLKARAQPGSAFYEEVINFALQNDLRQKEAYERFCEIVDIDSLIDWMIIEGYSANADIYNGNLRYCRSTEGDGKWRFMLYDMDSTMLSPSTVFNNVLTPNSTQCAVFIQPLMRNPEFAQRFLSRAGNILTSTLNDENVIAELERLCALIAPEVARDYARFGYSVESWEANVRALKENILLNRWSERCVDALCRFFDLSAAERTLYFEK